MDSDSPMDSAGPADAAASEPPMTRRRLRELERARAAEIARQAELAKQTELSAAAEPVAALAMEERTPQPGPEAPQLGPETPQPEPEPEPEIQSAPESAEGAQLAPESAPEPADEPTSAAPKPKPKPRRVAAGTENTFTGILGVVAPKREDRGGRSREDDDGTDNRATAGRNDGGGGNDTGSGLMVDDERPRKKRRWGVLVVVLILVGALVGAGVVAWNMFGDRIVDAMGWQDDDFEGAGNGVEVNFTILPGDTGTDIGVRLEQEGVVKSSDAFIRSVLAMPDEPVFMPGTYAVQQEMSAAAALVALTDEENRIENTVTIPEGTIMRDVFELVEGSVGIPVAELEAAAADPGAYGLPAEATTLEGFLFPATYTFEPGTDAEGALTTMVDRTYDSLAAAGVPDDQVWDVIRLASLIEKEARFEDDFYRVSRVFLNRIDIDMPLQSDATVTYGTGAYDRASTTDSERGDSSNPYNTYQHSGMIVGPISNPGDLAIDAAMNPADGPWLYFVTVNLDTGETVFTETYEEHLVAVDEWLRWLEDNPEYE